MRGFEDKAYVTEDDIGFAVNEGRMTVEEAVAAFEGDEVFVYSARPIDRATATWEERENAASGSVILFHMLTIAGATEEQMDHIGAQIIRLRAIGNIFV